VDLIAAVYRIQRLDNGQNRYKVDINAKENHMTGGCARMHVSVTLI
jgi:hypothetical protein